jgi:hypothetical protein
MKHIVHLIQIYFFHQILVVVAMGLVLADDSPATQVESSA